MIQGKTADNFDDFNEEKRGAFGINVEDIVDVHPKQQGT